MSIIYTPEELAKVWKVSTMTIYKLIGQNKIPHFRVGRAYRIPEEHLQAYAEREGNLKEFISKKGGALVPEVARHFIDLLKKEPKVKQKNVLEVRLFGSYARGEETKDSDVDLLMVLENHSSKENRWVASLSDLAMEKVDYNDLLSIVRMSKQHWEEQQRIKTPLYEEIEKDGILLWPESKSLNHIENGH